MVEVAHDADAPSGERRHRRTEIAALLVLAISAFGSSFANFQESLWDGEQDAHYALGMAAQSAAGKEETIAVQRESVNAMQFMQWLNAYAAGNDELANFYRERFQPAFRPVFDQWLESRPRVNPDSAPSPFDIPGYREQTRTQARRLARQAEQYFETARNDTRVSDRYGQSVVIFALALFLGGIVQGFENHRLRLSLVILGFAASAIGLLSLTGMPAIRLM